MAQKPLRDIRVSASDALEFEPEPRRKRRIPTTVWLLLVLILVTAAGLGGFLFGDRLIGLGSEMAGQVPTIHAAEGPIKVRPENPGGQDIPFRDYDINNRMKGEEASTRVENLLPPPEQAKAPPQGVPASAGAQAPKGTSRTETLLPAAPTPAPQAVAKAPAAKAVPPEQPAAPAPAAQPTKSVAQGPLQLVPKSQQAPAAETVVAPPPPAPEVKPAAPAPAQTAKAAPAPEVKSASVANARLGAGWQVQLAAARDIKAAQAEGERLKSKHSDLLGGMRVSVMQADLGAKGMFYRVRLGPAKDQDHARTLCTQLTKRGQGCLAVAPGK